MDNPLVEQVRSLLKDWDDGLITQAEFKSQINKFSIGDPFELLEKGETLMRFGSCCCPSGHPPDRTFKVEVTMQPHGYTAKRCD